MEFCSVCGLYANEIVLRQHFRRQEVRDGYLA